MKAGKWLLLISAGGREDAAAAQQQCPPWKQEEWKLEEETEELSAAHAKLQHTKQEVQGELKEEHEEGGTAVQNHTRCKSQQDQREGCVPAHWLAASLPCGPCCAILRTSFPKGLINHWQPFWCALHSQADQVN